MVEERVNIIEKIESEQVIIALRSDGILHFHLRTKKEITLEEVRNAFENVKKLMKGKKHANLITFEDYVNISPEARTYMASEEANVYTLSDAFVVKSIALYIMFRFYLQFNKPIKLTRIFNAEEKAVAWLRTFIID